MVYSLEIEFFSSNKEKIQMFLNKSYSVTKKNNLSMEECIKETFKWRIRPFSKIIKKVYIFIQPFNLSDNDNTSSNTSSTSNYTDTDTNGTTHPEKNDGSTQSNNNTTGSSPERDITVPLKDSTYESLQEEEYNHRDYNNAIIKKKIDFASYGKFLNFLKSYCLKHNEGSFKISFCLDNSAITLPALHKQIVEHEAKMKNKILNCDLNHLLRKTTKMVECNTLIGLGAFGAVYKGTCKINKSTLKIDSQTQSQATIDCAIKVIPFASITNYINVYRELYILDLMTNANDELKKCVVGYYGTLIDDEYLYVIMEYLPGPCLTHYVTTTHTNCNSKSAKDILQIALHLSESIRLLHSFNITHRDIKPGNIMADHNGKFKIVDFGFAALLNNQKGKVSSLLICDNKLVGTYRFSSPEVLSFVNNIDWEKADYWSLGTVLYFLVTGKHFLEKNSKERHDMLNILHKRMDTRKPLCIVFSQTIFDNLTLIKSSALRKNKKKVETLIQNLLEYATINRKNLV